jgi:hypothetical protein
MIGEMSVKLMIDLGGDELSLYPQICAHKLDHHYQAAIIYKENHTT